MSYRHKEAQKVILLLALLCGFKAFGVALAGVCTIDSACMNPPDQINEKKEELTREILRYLIKNPKAQDPLKHIVKWWLLDRYQTKSVEEVLNKLVADGLVIVQEISPSQALYKMDRRRRRRIISILAKDVSTS